MLKDRTTDEYVEGREAYWNSKDHNKDCPYPSDNFNDKRVEGFLGFFDARIVDRLGPKF